ncbi:MAG: formate dehydrogenase subunit gamma [Hyphomicrobiaceae bacterium]
MSSARWFGAIVAAVVIILMASLTVWTFGTAPRVVPTVSADAAPTDGSGLVRAQESLAQRTRLLGDRQDAGTVGGVAVAPDRVPGATIRFTRGVERSGDLVTSWQRAAVEKSEIARGQDFTRGISSLPYENANLLEQPQGRGWRRSHNATIFYGGAWVIGGVTLLLALFLAWRGRIRIAEGRSGRSIERFDTIERTNHWMTAGAFVVLALSGLTILYGKTVLMPLIGEAAYGDIALASAWLHMSAALPLTIGVLVMAVLWMRRNLPSRVDVEWLRRGGGFLHDGGDNPPARKFNAGQKVVFWGVLLGSFVALCTGIFLMVPFLEFGIQGMQWIQLLHAAIGLLMIGLIIGHIYIGTIGMEGAIDAMWSGRVDENWAKEHHSLWVRGKQSEAVDTRTPPAPAE